jgi:hypothetical protein
MEATEGWVRCSSCKGDIDFGDTYYACSVSTCNRKGTEFRFCSVECWDVHVPVMRHRDAGAEERKAPTQAEWLRDNPPEPEEAPKPASAARAPSSPDDLREAAFNEKDLPHDVLIVASKLKAYVRARSGMNTSDAVMEVLSDRVRALCDRAMQHAVTVGRKTVMDRDFE